MKSFTLMKLVIIVIFILCMDALCFGEAESDVAPMVKTEQEALYSAIQGFVGNGWNGSDLYPDPCGWTPIQGVSCDLFDGFWYVTAINIGPTHDNSLSCAKNIQFRPQLFQLEHLKTLSFFNCFVSPHKHPVTIPTRNWERYYESLESLEFRSNPGLIGQIPSVFGGLKKLQSLVLLENGLTGQIPANIDNLINLKRLVLAGNSFSGQIPNGFGGLTKLLILDFSRNILSGYLPNSLGSLCSLLKLDLSNNLLEGNFPAEIGNLNNLTLIDLGNNNLTGGLSNSLQKLNSLEEMVLSNNPIGGNLKSIEWQNMDKLVILDLSKTGLEGEIPKSITKLKRLRFLGLSDNNLSGIVSLELANLPNISALYLNGNNLTGELKFSEGFYRKMGRRFGALKNPNLCYDSIGLKPARYVPFGVKPCQIQVKIVEPNSEARFDEDNSSQNSHFLISLGFSRYSIDGFQWIIIVEVLMIVPILCWFI